MAVSFYIIISNMSGFQFLLILTKNLLSVFLIIAKKMTFELRFEDTVGVSHLDIQGKRLPGRGAIQGKTLEVSVPDVLQE